MSLLDLFKQSNLPLADRVTELSEELRQQQENNLLLQESFVDLGLAVEDLGWRRFSAEASNEFTRVGLSNITLLCRLMAVKNPLIRRGLALRHFYVWGEGLEVGARATGKDGDQDVNAVVQKFWDEPSNQHVLTGAQAAEENERALGTDGNLLFALFTTPRTGAVRVRCVPWDEIDDIVCNPEDYAECWYYRRTWTEYGENNSKSVKRAFYPDVNYHPPSMPTSYNGIPIMRNAPVVHVRVNCLKHWKWGIPDAYAALDWAKAFKEYLEDWARLMKSLSRFAWRSTTKGSKAAATAAKIAASPTLDVLSRTPLAAGATAIMAPDQSLEAIPKTGASIDSESGRPLATMVAAAMDVPVTMLLGDPGLTGARATAETLDQPTRLAAEARRQLWTSTMTIILNYVIDQSVRAPQGQLKGTTEIDDYDNQIVVLNGDTERTLDFNWPDLTQTDVSLLVEAIVKADATAKLPSLTIARLLLEALEVEDIDEILEELTDENGDFVPPEGSAGQAAVNAFRQGQDPAAVVGDGTTPPPPAAAAKPPAAY